MTRPTYRELFVIAALIALLLIVAPWVALGVETLFSFMDAYYQPYIDWVLGQ